MLKSQIIFRKSRPIKALLSPRVSQLIAKMPGNTPKTAKQAQYLLHWLDTPYEQQWPSGSHLPLRKLIHNGQQYELLRRAIKVTGRKNWLGGRKLFVANSAKYVSQFLARKRSFRGLYQAIRWEYKWLKLQFK